MKDTNFIPWTVGIVIKSCINNMKKRDDIIIKLRKQNIETKYGFKKPDYFEVKNYKKNFVNSKNLTNSVIVLPFHLNLNEHQVKYICQCLNKNL